MRIDNPEDVWFAARRAGNQNVAERGHLPCVDHCGHHVVLPSGLCPPRHHFLQHPHDVEDCTVLTSSHLTWQHSRELLVDGVLGLMDIALYGHVSVKFHVSNICIPPLALGGGISSCVTASFPSFRPGTASFRLLPFDATEFFFCRAGGWHLRRKPCVEAPLRPFFSL